MPRSPKYCRIWLGNIGRTKTVLRKSLVLHSTAALCVRYCAEIKQKNAVGFVDRGPKEISFIPEIAASECWDCKECFPLCPTSAFQAAFVLVEALAFPSASAKPTYAAD